jgi:hypothetical protein
MMSKKHWIYIKRGLSEDPKHRAAMGECIWLYMHIIDRADWETGIAFGWKDKEEAADMSMPVDTLRRQRQKLQELDYIRTEQRQHSQDIYIMEWKNPRDYGSETRNPRNQGSHEQLLLKDGQGSNQGLNEGSNQVIAQVKTPTYSSKSKSESDDSKPYDRKKGIEEAKKCIEEQRAKKGDIIDLLVSTSPALQEQTLMRQRVENALHRNLDWDSAHSPWNGYEKKLVSREKENGQTVEGFMQWFNSDEFRRKGVIYLNPTKIEDWWLQAFDGENQEDYHTRQVNRMERL